MRVFGIDLPRPAAEQEVQPPTLVLLDEYGRVAKHRRTSSLAEAAAGVVELAAGEPFLLGVNVPLVIPAKAARSRPVESLIRRRFGVRMPPGGRAAVEPQGIPGEALMAGLAAAGHPCLPYPDRDLRRPGLAETYPPLILKTLLWEGSPLSSVAEQQTREELFRAYSAPTYRSAQMKGRNGWAEQAVQIDHVLSLLQPAQSPDVGPVREALTQATSSAEIEAVAGLLDACLIAGTARRYLEAPETCLFLGDQENGYVVVPANSFVRRIAMAGGKEPSGRLFPQASLRQRLGKHARLRSMDLLSVPGRPQRTEARFDDQPCYEFDNVDEMLWWKHCRHLSGPRLPVDGLRELVVLLSTGSEVVRDPQLRLARSRHRTLSFRFEPPSVWRSHVPTRDGRTYPFKVVSAVYETL